MRIILPIAGIIALIFGIVFRIANHIEDAIYLTLLGFMALWISNKLEE